MPHAFKFYFSLLFTICSLLIYGQVITTFAGTGVVGSGGNGGPATQATLYDPQTVCSDNNGNIYTCEPSIHVVRKINPAGVISIFTGTGTLGNTGDGGAADKADIGSPFGICSDKAGNIYISDQYYAVIRKVNTAGVISTIAGNGTIGYSGDGGPALMAQMNGNQNI